MVETIAGWLAQIPSDAALWCVVVAFIALDVLVGTIKAFATKTVSSEKARLGVLHKMGFICAMLLCTVIDIAQSIADLGFEVPTLSVCSVMIILCEIYSLAEQIHDMNPDINLSFLEKHTDRNNDKENDDGKEA